MNQRVLLMILDGYGFSQRHEHNAIFLARKPHIDKLMAQNPHYVYKALKAYLILKES